MARDPIDRVAAIGLAWVLWVLVGGTFTGLLMLEYAEISTEPMFLSVSGCFSDQHDSTNGVAHWQWDPPGTYCVIERSPDIARREVFARPRAWRWAVLATLVVTLPLLAWVSVRVFRRARRDDARTAT